jgi:glutamyl-tRNA synthetase
MPTYHLANIVDDHLMRITHVIRGEEWLPSAPLHVLLYRFFGWTAPRFAHLPLLLKPDGNGKLSKRDGDRLGFPVFPLRWTDPKTGDVSSGYRESGYFPEAFVNLLALLGWNPGTEQELMTMDELVALFSLERVNKSGARFDPEKAKWFNQQYLRRHSDAGLATLFIPVLASKGINAQTATVEKIVALVKDRVNFVNELWDQSWFFFTAPQTYDEVMVKKRWKPESGALISQLAEKLTALPHFTTEALDAAVNEFLVEKQVGMGAVMTVLRLAVIGSGMGPHLTEVIALIGPDEFARRIKNAVTTLQ